MLAQQLTGMSWFNLHFENKIKGFENLSLIPGSVGASPIQNIGAYGAMYLR